MTTELERTFFDTFGIEPKLNDCNWQCQKPSKLIYMCANNNDCEHCKEYPQITDRQYLELMCLYTKEIRSFVCVTSNLKLLKEEILEEFISEKDGFSKHQVQAIFEGE